jgi:hypothetical protein
MSASDRLDVEVRRNALGDWIIQIEGAVVAGIVWDDQPGETPLLVVWDEDGEAGERRFPLFELLPSLARRAPRR